MDGLRVPGNPSEAPSANSPDDRFYCLLEDDSLVSKVTVETEQLLRECPVDFVIAVIHVNIKKTRTSYDNIAF